MKKHIIDEKLLSALNKPLLEVTVNRTSKLGRILVGPVGGILSFLIGAGASACVVILIAIGGVPVYGPYRGTSSDFVIPPDQMINLIFITVPFALLGGFASFAGWYIWKHEKPG